MDAEIMDLFGSARKLRAVTTYSRAPKDRRNIRILQTMVSGIPLILGLRTRM